MKNEETKIALFTNFSDTPFTGYWNGKGRTFEPGESKWIPDFLARHFAKHLTNREILKIPRGETMTSPKKPEQIPQFMELFNKSYKEDSKKSPTEEKKDAIDAIIEAENRNRNEGKETVAPEEKDEEEVFEGSPEETK